MVFQFLPLRDFDDVTSALNFDTPDCRVVGGCDLYTTKAAGSDKKLYKNIDKSLENQYESLLKISASLSPPQQSAEMASMNLSRSSPFGPLSQISSRKTFAYLIAVLNASHPDYDFSHVLRPSDFSKERNLKAVMNSIDTTLYGVRPNAANTLHVPSQTTYTTTSSPPPSSQAWGPQMWMLIDKEMSLNECNVYSYLPEDDPLDGEETAIWSMNYFFFNKQRKRVAYIYLRGIPVIGHSPRNGHMAKRTSGGFNINGAGKRAKYWLGDRANAIDEDDEEDDSGIALWSDDIEDNDRDDFVDDYDDDVIEESDEERYISTGRTHSVSEEGFRMELD
jgi:hypothetical protein